MAADSTSVAKSVTEILNASAPATFSATIDPNNLQYVAGHITEAMRYGAMLIARAILSNPSHVHRNVFLPNSPLSLTNGGELPDMAGESDLIEILPSAQATTWRIGVPRPVQEIISYRTSKDDWGSVYSSYTHSDAGSPLSGYYGIENGRVFFTGYLARIYSPLITRSGDTGVAQVETAVVDGGVAENNTATITITAAGMPGSPIVLTQALTAASHGTATLVAQALAAKINSDLNASAFFTATNSSGSLIITAKAPRANDTTMNLALSFAPGTPPSNVATSANTTAGVAPGVTTLIPDEYESTWVALSAGFCLKQDDNLAPIAQYYMDHGTRDLAAIEQMGIVAPLTIPEAARKARGDV